MLQYALRRGLLALAVALTVSFVAFLLINYATDPALSIAGEDADQAAIDHVRQMYGFDRPLIVQYTGWLWQLAQGNLGESFYWRRPISELILSRAPTTITLALSATLVTILIALPLAAIAGTRPNSAIDRFCLGLAVTAQAIPNFWLSLMLIIFLAVWIPIFPVSGSRTWWHFVLPAFVLGASSVPAVMRLTRGGLIEVMSSDYIRTARAKGYRGWRLLTRHALRNAVLPVVSVLAVQLGNKLGGSVIVESVFALNGLGRLALDSIVAGDVYTLQMLVFIFALTFVTLTFLADVLNAWLDPRLRLR